MKKQISKVLALILSVIMVIGLIGCGNGGGSGAGSNGKTIRIYAQTNGLGQDWLNNAAKAYKEKNGTTVEVQFDAYLSTNLTTTLENESIEVMDLYYVQTYEWGPWSYNDYLTDLTDFMNEKDDSGKSLNDRMTSTKRCNE